MRERVAHIPHTQNKDMVFVANDVKMGKGMVASAPSTSPGQMAGQGKREKGGDLRHKIATVVRRLYGEL